jgi:capsular exopolysaccharide synthesis family protein
MAKWQISDKEELVIADENENSYLKILDRFKDNWALFITSLLIGFTVAFLANRYTTPIYIVEASLLIKAEKETANPVSDLLYGEEFFGRNATNLENEAALLQSSGLIKKTLDDLELSISYFLEGKVRHDELYTSSPIKLEVLSESSNIPYKEIIKCIIIDKKQYQLEYLDERSIGQKLLEKFTGAKPPKIMLDPDKKHKFGDTVKIDGFGFYINLDEELYKENRENSILFELHHSKSLTKSYRSLLEVTPLSLDSSVLNISMESDVPDKTIDFINILIGNYIDGELERKNHAALKTIEFIDTQINYMSDSLALMEDRLEDFKKENKAIDLSEEGTKLYGMNQSLNTEKAELMVSNKFLDDLLTYVQSNSLSQLILPSSMGINEPVLNELVQQLMDLQEEVSIMTGNRNLNNPMIRLKQQEIEGLKANLLENIRTIRATNEYKLNEINSRLGFVNSSLRNLPSAERKLIDIQRNYDLNEELYLFLMQKRAEAGIAKASNAADYRVIDSAEIRGVAPVRPSPILNYALAIFLGLSIPIIMLFLHGLINRKIGSKEKLESLTQIPLLGVVAHNSTKSNAVVAHEFPRSSVSESFRSLRSNLRYMINDDPGGKVFLVTSSVSGEGKSFCAKNLAYIFSNFGKKVVLINADMRKHYSYEDYGVEISTGLSEYLASMCSLEEVLNTTKFENFYLITAGGLAPNPSELLINGRFDTLVSTLSQSFDYIILDTPPIGILADGIELMKNSHVNLFIVRHDYTFLDHIKELEDLCANNQIKNGALIYNDVKLKKHKYGYGYYDENYSAKSDPVTRKVLN